MKKITDTDLAGKGILELPDVPGLESQEMRRRFDELPREVITPAFNSLIDELGSTAGAAAIGSAGGGVQAELNAVNTALLERAQKTEVLIKGGETAFTPSGDYDPATKKYVDDTLVAIGAGDMTKAVYDTDNDGIVDSAETAANANFALNGFHTYTHIKVGTEHRLTLEGGGNNILFVATAAFAAGDTFKVNGTECTAIHSTGKALRGGTFVSGTLVSCFKNGTVLSFAGAQAELGFTPVQQAGGVGQTGNKIYLGWSATGLKVQVDVTEMGNIITDSINSKAILPIAKGGTGATTAAAARANLGVLAMQVVDALPSTLEANTVYFVY